MRAAILIVVSTDLHHLIFIIWSSSLVLINCYIATTFSRRNQRGLMLGLLRYMVAASVDNNQGPNISTVVNERQQNRYVESVMLATHIWDAGFSKVRFSFRVKQLYSALLLSATFQPGITNYSSKTCGGYWNGFTYARRSSLAVLLLKTWLTGWKSQLHCS